MAFQASSIIPMIKAARASAEAVTNLPFGKMVKVQNFLIYLESLKDIMAALDNAPVIRSPSNSSFPSSKEEMAHYMTMANLNPIVGVYKAITEVFLKQGGDEVNVGRDNLGNVLYVKVTKEIFIPRSLAVELVFREFEFQGFGGPYVPVQAPVFRPGIGGVTPWVSQSNSVIFINQGNRAMGRYDATGAAESTEFGIRIDTLLPANFGYFFLEYIDSLEALMTHDLPQPVLGFIDEFVRAWADYIVPTFD